MKKIILSMIGISFLFLSCNRELIEFQEDDSFSFSTSSAQLAASCEPDIQALEESLPETVTVGTLDPECNTGYFQLNISEGYLAGEKITAWCSDIEGILDIDQTVTYDVYSSSQDVSSLNEIFANTDKFDEVNWLLNQSFIGKESGVSKGEGENYVYAFGHIQAAIWKLVDNKSCTGGGCFYLTCSDAYGTWSDADELMSDELVAAALEHNGFEPQCGDQIAIVLASSTDQSLIITIDVPEKEIPCAECEGKVTDLTLQYNGTEKANITVETKKEGEDGSKIVFEGMVEAGAKFSFTGNDKKGTLGPEIIIYVDGNENAKIHTSCSKPIGPGLISGDFEVISGSSREGGALCPVDTPPGSGDDCDECKGKVTRLDLQYNGENSADIKVVQKKDGIVAFSGNVNAGDTFTFYGKDDKGTLGTEIIIYVNGFEAQKIHTSCSVEIGAGSVFGDFTVESGASREGGEFCPVDTPPPSGGDDCGECDGKVTRLDLQYSGSVDDTIKIVQKKDGAVVFDGSTNGNTITIYGEWKKGTLGTEIIIYVNGSEAQRIHTSCSVPISTGSVFGDFTVMGGASLNGGEFCTDVSSPA